MPLLAASIIIIKVHGIIYQWMEAAATLPATITTISVRVQVIQHKQFWITTSRISSQSARTRARADHF
jgi:TRAP-type uncharacterized transport system fused permease subunit